MSVTITVCISIALMLYCGSYHSDFDFQNGCVGMFWVICRRHYFSSGVFGWTWFNPAVWCCTFKIINLVSNMSLTSNCPLYCHSNCWYCKVKKNMVLLVDYVLNAVLPLKPIHAVNQISGWLSHWVWLVSLLYRV